MEEIKKSFSKIWYGGVAGSVLFFFIGILLLAVPEMIISIISTIIGLGIVILGVFALLRYFRNKDNTFNFDLMYGIVCTVAGIVLITNPTIVAGFLPIILGVWMIGNSVIKIQYAMTLKEYKSNNWLSIMIVSILTLACGILFVFNPFKGAKIITQVLGISLIIYSLVDIVNSIILKKNIKSFVKGVKKVKDDIKEAVYEEVEEDSKEKKNNKKKSSSRKKITKKQNKSKSNKKEQ